ncbi:hypothetical protein H4R20_005232 [Coemansia guatemalensis]|uniref:Chromo domain-containing protein n=1 Tax=Coemansia guatemalensis TaxID=2761395 RepID=A0A9W8HT54_9FUNG|nr:hypothetical protein H4R20_005232 [Coemansia guatemalensis]
MHDSFNEQPLEVLYKPCDLPAHPGTIRDVCEQHVCLGFNLSKYQMHMVLDFNKKHPAADLQHGDHMVLIDHAAGKHKVVPMGPFHIQTVAQNGGYTLEWDDTADAPEPLMGTFKTHHLIPVDKAMRLPDDVYEVDFIHNHRLRVGKVPLYLVHWRGYRAQHDTWEPATNFDDPSLVTAYQATKPPMVQAQLQESMQWATRQVTKCRAAGKAGGDVVGISRG